MDRTILLMLGSALVLAGVFGAIEAFIAMRKRPRRQVRHAAAFAADEESGAPFDEWSGDAPAIAPTDEDFEMVVVRERETNPDGRPRQDIIKELQVGDPVVLLPEAARPDGRDEIRVVAPGGTIGYVPAAKVPQLLDVLNDGAQTHSEVSHIAEAEELRGVWINVSVWR